MTNLVKSFHFFKPFFNSNKFNRFWTNELTYTFATESIVIFHFVFDDLWIWHNFHIIMIIWVFANHVNELISCKFLLSHHLKECGNLGIVDFIWLFAILFGRNRLNFERLENLRFLYWWLSGGWWRFFVEVIKGVAPWSAASSRYADIECTFFFLLWVFARSDARQYLESWIFIFFSKRLLLSLLNLNKSYIKE